MHSADLVGEVAELMPGFLYIYEEAPDGSARFVYASKRVEELFAVSQEELVNDAAAAWSRGHPDDLVKIRESIDQATAEFREWRCDFRVIHPQRGVIRLQGRAVPRLTPDGTMRWFGFHHDVSEAREAQEALKAKSLQLDQFFELSTDLLAVWHTKTGAVRLSRGWARALGVPTEELLRAPYDEIVHPGDLKRFRVAYRDIAAALDVNEQRTRFMRGDGGVVVIDWRGTLGEDDLAYIVARDVTDKLAAEQRLQEAKKTAEERARALAEANRRAEHAALHDTLTSLPNRRYLEQIVAARNETGEGTIAALHLDLDDFKEINDRFGHPIGDEVLRRSANQLAGQLEDGDFLARVGGDEFVVISERFANVEEASDFAAKLVSAVAAPFHCGSWFHRIGVSVSVGVAVAPTAGANTDALLADADVALYRAKAAGGRRVEAFADWMRTELRRRKTIAARIELGLRCGEFEAFYQPQICARTGAVAAVEALARWRHAAEGLLTPGRFIQTAEEMGLLAELDRRILHAAYADFARLREISGRAPRLSVNVSARRLAELSLVDEIRALDPAPGSLCFELVESIIFDDGDDAVFRNAQALRNAGVEIELDDFGSGHASIIGLMKLRPSRLKIDRRLVTPITENAEARSLVRSIVGIGRSLGVGVVAEGVESFEHAHLLAGMGCSLLQGYAFAKPMPFAEIVELLEERPWLRRFSGRAAAPLDADASDVSVG